MSGKASTSMRIEFPAWWTWAFAVLTFAVQVAHPSALQAQQDAAVSGRSARVEQLLKQLTLDEKIQLMHGTGEDALTGQGQAGYLEGVPRLGIPPLRLADGPPGVLTRIPAAAPTSTMGLAATFSVTDAKRNGELMAHEARARGIDVVLQPFLNMDRDFRWGRGYNTYGEDPLLTGMLGAAFIHGVQDLGIMAQAKHYIAYDTDAPSVHVDEQTLHEFYLAPFTLAVNAGVSSIMCSYNRINGPYACGNSETLNSILKDELGFQGFVTSDWGATHGTDFAKAGLDMEMPGPLPEPWTDPSFFVLNPQRENEPEGIREGTALTDIGLPEEPATRPGQSAKEPDAKPASDLKHLVEAGIVPEKAIDDAVRRILTQMNRFGLLGRTTAAPVAASAALEPGDIDTLRRTAIDAAVLLKNQDAILPLKADALKNIVLIGPGAAQLVAVGQIGEKAVGLPELETSPFAALKQLAGPEARISLAVANDMDGAPVPAANFSHFGLPGLERRAFRETAVHIDPQIDFTIHAGNALPAREHIVWTGTLAVPAGGTYRLHLQLLGCFGKLKIDGKLIAKNWYNWIHGELVQPGQDNIFSTSDGLDNMRAAVPLTAGEHSIRIEVEPDSSNQSTQVRLNWVTPQQQEENYRAAIEAARQAKVAVVFAWSRLRPDFGLPGEQDRLISDVAAVNPNTIVVLNVSQPVALPWLGKVKAVLQMWWPGDEGGWATAGQLLGQNNPAGRLPFTWPHRAQDMPANDPAFPDRSDEGVHGETTYSEGIFVGYRWFDRQKIEPLFPFGFGLSYTHFAYSKLRVEAASDGGETVCFQLQNTGSMAGEEVAQVYLGAPKDPTSGVQFAVRALIGFERVMLQPGASREVCIPVSARSLKYWSTTDHDWKNVAGDRTIDVGASSKDLRIHAVLASRPAPAPRGL